MPLAGLGVSLLGKAAGFGLGSLIGGEPKTSAASFESVAQDIQAALAGNTRGVHSAVDALKKEGQDVLIDAFNQAIESSRQGAADTREILDPFRTGGLEAFDKFLSREGLGSDPVNPDLLEQEFLSTPGAQFQLDQGRRAIESSASSRGLLGSGRILKELDRFGQGLAAQHFGDTQNRLLDAARLGSNIGIQQANLLATQNRNTADLQAQLRTQRAGIISQAEGARANFFSNQAQSLLGNLIDIQKLRAEKFPFKS